MPTPTSVGPATKTLMRYSSNVGEEAQREMEKVQRQKYEDTVQQRVHDLGTSRELAVYLVDLETKVGLLVEHSHTLRAGGYRGSSSLPIFSGGSASYPPDGEGAYSEPWLRLFTEARGR